MEARELRIGNLIASGTIFSETSLIGTVLEIGNEEREFEQIYCECEESFEWFFKDNYCGIPLTPDWLLKMGFDGKDNWMIKKEYVFCSGILIYIRPDVKRENIKGRNFKYTRGNFIADGIKYVHQLQNLYFALTGQELTFNP